MATDAEIQEVFHLLGSHAYQVLNVGQAVADFYQRLKQLREADKSHARKLEAICARLKFVEQLGSLDMKVSPERERQAEYQLDRLKTYVTLTTIDIAAGKKTTEYQFHDWLKHILKRQLQPTNLTSAIEALAICESTEDIAPTFVKWISTLYEQDFRPEAGAGTNFRRFVTDAPDWLCKWLADAYVLVPRDEDIVNYYTFQGRLTWFMWDYKQKCEEIARYLFNLRNKYTHTVDYRPPKERRHGTMHITVNGIEYGFDTIYKDGDIDGSVENHVGLRVDVAESDMIRFIVIARLREWLGIVDDESFLDMYLKRMKYRRLGYHMLSELRRNREIVRDWCFVRAQQISRVSTLKQLEFYLHDTALRAFMAYHQEIFGNQSISISSPDGYLECAKRINHRFDEINEQHAGQRLQAWEEIELKSDLVTEMVNSQDVGFLVYAMNDIERDFSRNLDAGIY